MKTDIFILSGGIGLLLLLIIDPGEVKEGFLPAYIVCLVCACFLILSGLWNIFIVNKKSN